jgi:hypothetical protein
MKFMAEIRLHGNFSGIALLNLSDASLFHFTSSLASFRFLFALDVMIKLLLWKRWIRKCCSLSYDDDYRHYASHDNAHRFEQKARRLSALIKQPERLRFAPSILRLGIARAHRQLNRNQTKKVKSEELPGDWLCLRLRLRLAFAALWVNYCVFLAAHYTTQAHAK